jgi:RNA polymerase sigma-70 factor (ECF subfamily)
MDDRPDGAVVSVILAGDVEAFAVLVHRYRDAYTRFAIRMLGNLDDADDALQSAFVRAFRSLRKCNDPERFGRWLYQIVVNECRTLSASRARRERRFVLDEVQLDAVADEARSERDATVEEIQLALDRLEPEHREAFILKHVEELSYEEMAEITGASVSALKMRVKRACERLRELLEGAYHD